GNRSDVLRPVNEIGQRQMVLPAVAKSFGGDRHHISPASGGDQRRENPSAPVVLGLEQVQHVRFDALTGNGEQGGLEGEIVFVGGQILHLARRDDRMVGGNDK